MRFLVVEDDEAVARAIARQLRSEGSVVIAATLTAARRKLAAQSFDAMIIDVLLPDGSGLELLHPWRVDAARPRALILSATVDAESLARAFAGDAHYILKPSFGDELKLFARRVRQGTASPDRLIQSRISEWCASRGLSEAEAAILELRSSGLPRAGLAASRNVSAETIGKQIKSLLAKTGAESLDDAVSHLLREALRFRSE